MLTLYYSPAAVSLASHIALEESGLPYDLKEVSIKQGSQLTPEYLAVNSLGRVPALRTESGEILTEVAAVHSYIADLVPERQLLPSTALERARALEWLSFFASSVHESFISFFRPSRYTEDPVAHEALKRDGKERFQRMLVITEDRLPQTPYLLGDHYTLCDASALVFYLWGRHFELKVQRFEKYSALAARLLQRPAVQRALAQEGLNASTASQHV